MQFFSQVDSSPSVITDVPISLFIIFFYFVHHLYISSCALFIYLFISFSLFTFWHFKRIWNRKKKNMKMNENISFIEWKVEKFSWYRSFQVSFLHIKYKIYFLSLNRFWKKIYFLVVHCSMDNWQPSVNIIREMLKEGKKIEENTKDLNLYIISEELGDRQTMFNQFFYKSFFLSCYVFYWSFS